MAAREEDKAMAGLLRRSLAQDAGAGSGSSSGEECPGPEILAAYFDRALDAQQTARYDLHFSGCSTCREQLAAMARAAGAEDAEKKTAGAWDWLAGPRWLMPAAAALVALLVITGIAWRMWKPVAPANEIAMSRPDAVAPPNSAPPPSVVPQPDKVAPLRVAPPSTTENLIVRPAAPSQREAAGAPVKPSESEASDTLGGTSASRVTPRASHANTAAQRDELSSVGAAGAKSPSAHTALPQAQTVAPRQSPGMLRGAMRVGSTSAAPVAPVNDSADATASVAGASPTLDTAVAPATPPAKKAETRSTESDTSAAVQTEEAKEANAPKTKLPVTAATPAHAVGAMNLSASQRTETAALAKMQQAQISSNLMNLQIPTPDAKILWMIAGPGAIEKSENSGASWKTEYLDTREPILAGAAPTEKICWLVGANGTILRTTNGTHWKTIGPPAETDFVRVEASDALTAAVTATDGRKFSTSDGGKSWSSVK
jgi:hypothetical protein